MCMTPDAALQGRGKKDAKQVSAAAVLEMLLVNVPESDFLMPGKAKQTKTVQVSRCLLTVLQCYCHIRAKSTGTAIVSHEQLQC